MASLVSKGVIVLKPENVAQLVFFMRGEKVMFDVDLAMRWPGIASGSRPISRFNLPTTNSLL